TTFNVPVTVTSGATLNQLGATPAQVSGFQMTFGQAISGAGGLSAGTPISQASLALEGANGYTGRTDVNQGTVILRGTTGALSGSTQITVSGFSTLRLDSSAATTGAGNIAGNETSQNRIRDDATLTL